ncbi:homocysteine S-methyltransferase family protein [Amycolatopsis kentuckyensis]|uniref:homocysteine S-methyltransferase family protein n=1 Tax=Amycolatopsis kentuckyensis TaxID=218823 RepID=UPI000A35F221
MPSSLETALSRGPVVIDGGLSNQLEAAGHDLSDELWTARLLRDEPSAIADAHAAYFAAGASVVLTASYQVGFAAFARHGIPAPETARLLHRSVSLARAARDAGPDRPLWIAASVGPYGATLADGSEYRGRWKSWSWVAVRP